MDNARGPELHNLHEGLGFFIIQDCCIRRHVGEHYTQATQCISIDFLQQTGKNKRKIFCDNVIKSI